MCLPLSSLPPLELPTSLHLYPNAPCTPCASRPGSPPRTSLSSAPSRRDARTPSPTLSVLGHLLSLTPHTWLAAEAHPFHLPTAPASIPTSTPLPSLGPRCALPMCMWHLTCSGLGAITHEFPLFWVLAMCRALHQALETQLRVQQMCPLPSQSP